MQTDFTFEGRGFRGGFFSGFYAQRAAGIGPGWFVYGSNPAYGGSYTMLCAARNVPLRKHRNYNCKVRTGWRTKREAQAIADMLNRKDADCRGMFAHLPLHGTVFKDSPKSDRA